MRKSENVPCPLGGRSGYVEFVRSKTLSVASFVTCHIFTDDLKDGVKLVEAVVFSGSQKYNNRSPHSNRSWPRSPTTLGYGENGSHNPDVSICESDRPYLDCALRLPLPAWPLLLPPSRSRYSRADQHAPAHPPSIVVTPMPRRSVFRDAAAVAGGVTVGTTMGHLAGEAITSLFTGRRREEVVHSLPQNYQLGTEPSGPCAFEIAQFLQCATSHENLQECVAFNEALRECKRRNRLP